MICAAEALLHMPTKDCGLEVRTTYIEYKNVVCYRVLIEPGRTLRVLVDSCFRSDFESCFRFFDSYGFEWQLDVFLAECNLKHG